MDHWDDLKHEGLSVFIHLLRLLVLVPEEATSLVAPFMGQEIQATLQSMKKIKHHALMVYWLTFGRVWPTIQNTWLILFNMVLLGSLMPGTWGQAITTVIHKSRKDPTKPDSYRPIMILNHDYKILMVLLASRLARIVPCLIHYDQCGFIPGRTTQDCTRRVLLMIQHAEETGSTLGLASLDAEKAFDRVEWPALFGILAVQGFPPSFISLISVLYRGVTTQKKMWDGLVVPYKPI